MAVRRSQNWISQQRVDVDHLKAVESAIRNDFDELFSNFVTGLDKSYVVRGFTLNMTGAIGSSANSLQMVVDNSALLHGTSATSGTFFEVASGTPNEVLNSNSNTKVSGSFTPSSLNYVGLDLTRTVDTSTIGTLYLWDEANKTSFTKTVPLAKTLNYSIVITSSIWSSNILPIALVETDASNNVISIEDNRPMIWRLGTAGFSTPDPFYKYPWSAGRSENFWKSTSSSSSPFAGGDKQLENFKDWADAVMSILTEVVGGPYWYSTNSSGSLKKIKYDLDFTQMTGAGKFIHSATTAGQVNWDSDLFLNLIGGSLSYKIVSNPSNTYVTLSDNQVAYITFVRDVDIIPNLIFTNGSAIVTSVGSFTWTDDILAGDYIKVGSSDDTKYYEVLSVDSSYQVTLVSNYAETSTGSGGVQAKYAYGFYEAVATPSTDRHVWVVNRGSVPLSEDLYWLFIREDNGGSVAKIYIKGSSGGELQQGEDRQVSDNQTLNTLTYIGSPSESTSTPDYADAVTISVAEVTTLTFPAASALASGQYFTINSSLDLHKYYLWANIDGAGGDPSVAGLTPEEVAFASTDTNIQVAAAYKTALDTIPYFNVIDNLDGTVTVTNSQVGDTTDAANATMGAGFSISIDTQGTGAPNFTIVDTENLTKSIKRLDNALGLVQESLDASVYDEKYDVVSGAPANNNEITGPIVATTTISIPKNSRDSSSQEIYTVGSADLQIRLNGNELYVGDDYSEVGTVGNDSYQIELLIDIAVGDKLEFRKGAAGGASGGGSTSGQNLGAASDADVFKQTVGNILQFRRLTAGANTTITEGTDDIVISSSAGVGVSSTNNIVGVNYTITTSDDVILASNSGSNITLTLPSALAAQGKIYYIKKIDSGNTLYVKSTGSETLDGTDIDASPYAVTIQYQSITIVSNGSSWYIL